MSKEKKIVINIMAPIAALFTLIYFILSYYRFQIDALIITIINCLKIMSWGALLGAILYDIPGKKTLKCTKVAFAVLLATSIMCFVAPLIIGAVKVRIKVLEVGLNAFFGYLLIMTFFAAGYCLISLLKAINVNQAKALQLCLSEMGITVIAGVESNKNSIEDWVQPCQSSIGKRTKKHSKMLIVSVAFMLLFAIFLSAEKALWNTPPYVQAAIGKSARSAIYSLAKAFSRLFYVALGGAIVGIAYKDITKMRFNYAVVGLVLSIVVPILAEIVYGFLINIIESPANLTSAIDLKMYAAFRLILNDIIWVGASIIFPIFLVGAVNGLVIKHKNKKKGKNGF